MKFKQIEAKCDVVKFHNVNIPVAAGVVDVETTTALPNKQPTQPTYIYTHTHIYMYVSMTLQAIIVHTDKQSYIHSSIRTSYNRKK